MNRNSAASREENYEHVLMCLICRSLFDDHDHQPKFLPCHHTFCKECLREYVRQTGDDIECPSCRKVATIPTVGVAALQTNFYIKYIQNLVQGGFGGEGTVMECSHHPKEMLKYYCKECLCSVCDACCAPSEKASCHNHKHLPLTAVAEDSHQKIDKAFAKSNALIEHKKVELEAMMKALSHEKDQALLKIDSTFESHVHTLNRRTTLLKNKVIDIYNEHVVKLEGDMEEISTALTCIVSLKEYHENAISKADFTDIESGISEMEEVHTNITEKIQPRENHIIFEDKHGMDKYKISVRDLGRVRCSRPTIPRSEPEGNDSIPTNTSPSTPLDLDADSPAIASSLSLPIAPTVSNSMSSSQVLSLVSSGSVNLDGMLQQNRTGHRAENPAMSAAFHATAPDAMSESTYLMKSSGDVAVEKRQSSVAHVNPQPPVAVDPIPPEAPDGQPSAMPTQSGDKPIMVVRPKTLNASAGILSKRPEKSNASRSAKIKPITNAAMMSIQAQLANGSQADGGEDDRPLRDPRAGFDLHQEDRNANMVGPGAGMSASMGSMDRDRLRQDKMYHHLVYTSYDEEELLKELQAGKVQIDAAAAANPSRRNTEEADSWTTGSSDGDSTISGNSDESAQRDITEL